VGRWLLHVVIDHVIVSVVNINRRHNQSLVRKGFQSWSKILHIHFPFFKSTQRRDASLVLRHSWLLDKDLSAFKAIDQLLLVFLLNLCKLFNALTSLLFKEDLFRVIHLDVFLSWVKPSRQGILIDNKAELWLLNHKVGMDWVSQVTIVSSSYSQISLSLHLLMVNALIETYNIVFTLRARIYGILLKLLRLKFLQFFPIFYSLGRNSLCVQWASSSISSVFASFTGSLLRTLRPRLAVWGLCGAITLLFSRNLNLRGLGHRVATCSEHLLGVCMGRFSQGPSVPPFLTVFIVVNCSYGVQLSPRLKHHSLSLLTLIKIC
jgi:hypothetical protein